MNDVARANGCRLWVHLPSRTATQEVASRYVYQNRLVGDGIYGDLTVDDNIRVATYAMSKQAAAEGRARALELFPALEPRLNLPARSLSGG